ncbi:MAG: hypothetical protein JXN59_06010 [Anaerolineae bacterium]|nr:hypothetical protein [Anaerolineae bacterium]
MLYQSDTDMLFPPRVIPRLAHLRGPEWQALVTHVSAMPQNHPDTLGFMLMMVRINGCMTCHADSYRAMRGCTLCAQQAVARYKGSDQELVECWRAAVQDIIRWQRDNTLPEVD